MRNQVVKLVEQNRNEGRQYEALGIRLANGELRGNRAIETVMGTLGFQVAWCGKEGAISFITEQGNLEGAVDEVWFEKDHAGQITAVYFACRRSESPAKLDIEEDENFSVVFRIEKVVR